MRGRRGRSRCGEGIGGMRSEFEDVVRMRQVRDEASSDRGSFHRLRGDTSEFSRRRLASLTLRVLFYSSATRCSVGIERKTSSVLVSP